MVRVDALCIADGAVCPLCGVRSNRVHGSYLRFPADVPSGGRSVVRRLRVRRFTCGNSGCARHTLVERIPGARPPAGSAGWRLDFVGHHLSKPASTTRRRSCGRR
ncbi:transposase family protein [Actinacidiphila glaucinigra]|uniref:transposase family protein n=1 Tax=Actinacidiphila glaucinigra TaxID=235986 RepID=UPI00370D0A75